MGEIDVGTGCALCGEPHAVQEHEAAIRAGDGFLALVTRHFVEEDHHHREIEIAMDADQDLVAFVERGVDWTEYAEYPWDVVERFGRETFQTDTAFLVERYKRLLADG